MTNGITVTGTGIAARPPDMASINLGVEVIGRSVAEARSQASAAADGVIGSLRSNGLADRDIATSAYSIQPEFDHRDGRRLRGYRVANNVEAVCRDLSAVGAIIDAAAAAGGDNTLVAGLSFGFEDEGELSSEARRGAWRDAEHKAQELAALAGLELGKAVVITERSHATPRPALRAMAREVASQTPIEPGESAVTVTVEVQFALVSQAASPHCRSSG